MLIIPKPPPEPAELDLRPRHPYRRAAWLGLKISGAILLLLVLAGIFFRMQAMFRETKDRTELAPENGRFLPAGDTQIFAQDIGPREGPVVILIPGPGAWSEIWRETMDALVADGYRAISLDLPPFGFSDRARTDYSRAAQARRIMAVLNIISVPEVTLVGHSVSAAPVMEAASQMPRRVRALVLVDAVLGSAPDPGPAGWLLGFGPVRNAFVSALVTNPSMTESLLARSVSNRSAVTGERVDMLRIPLEVKGTTDAVGKWLFGFFSPGDKIDDSVFSSLIMPTLVIWGREDAVEPLAKGEALNRILPDSELAVMEGAGHSPHIEDSKEFNETLLEFLGRYVKGQQ